MCGPGVLFLLKRFVNHLPVSPRKTKRPGSPPKFSSPQETAKPQPFAKKHQEPQTSKRPVLRWGGILLLDPTKSRLLSASMTPKGKGSSRANAQWRLSDGTQHQGRLGILEKSGAERFFFFVKRFLFKCFLLVVFVGRCRNVYDP